MRSEDLKVRPIACSVVTVACRERWSSESVRSRTKGTRALGVVRGEPAPRVVLCGAQTRRRTEL